MKSLRLLFALLSAPLFAAIDINKPIAEVKLKDGRTLKNVEIVSLMSGAVMAKWDGGRGTIRHEQMPADLRAAMPTKAAAAAPEPTPTVQSTVEDGVIRELRLPNGTVFRNVTLERFEQETVVLKTSSGVTSLPYSYFPEPQRTQMISIRDSLIASRKESAAAERVEEAKKAEAGRIAQANAEGARAAVREQVERAMRSNRIVEGMTVADASQSWGPPNRANTGSGGSLDQYIWARPDGIYYVYFTNGILTSWQHREAYVPSRDRR